MQGLVTEEELKEWTGYQQTGKLEQWLIKNGITFFYGKNNRICTTLAALNKERSKDDEIVVGF